MKKSFLLYIYLYCYALHAYLDIAKMGYEQYQDIIINNTVVQKANYNHFDCETRYAIIKGFLNQFERPFTLLDIGASQGYYSFRTAYDYPCVCVMIENNNKDYPRTGDQLLDLCIENTSLHNIIFLQCLLDHNKLARLGECEHFDVVLALNVAHRIDPQNWSKTIDLLLTLGSWLIIEVPPSENYNKKTDMELYVEQKGGIALGKAPRHCSKTGALATLYLVATNKDTITRKTYIQKVNTKEPYEVISTFKEKYIVKKNSKISWAPGINLLTFKMLNGVFPKSSTLLEALKNAEDMNHRDWMINNMILQGKKITMIDNDPTANYICNAKNIELTQKLLMLSSPEEVESFFWNILVPSVARLMKEFDEFD